MVPWLFQRVAELEGGLCALGPGWEQRGGPLGVLQFSQICWVWGSALQGWTSSTLCPDKPQMKQALVLPLQTEGEGT